MPSTGFISEMDTVVESIDYSGTTGEVGVQERERIVIRTLLDHNFNAAWIAEHVGVSIADVEAVRAMPRHSHDDPDHPPHARR